MPNKQINTRHVTILSINLSLYFMLIYIVLVIIAKAQTVGDAQIKPELIPQTGNPVSADKIIVSSDNNLLASFSNFDDGKKHDIIIWKISESKILRVIDEKSKIRSIAFSPDTKYLASGEDDFIRLLDVKTGEEVKSIPHQYDPKTVVFSPDGKKIAVADGSELIIWSLVTNQVLNVKTWCFNAKFSPDNKIIACQGPDINLIDSEKGDSIKILNADLNEKNEHINNVESINFSPDSNLIAILAYNFICLFDIKSGIKLKDFKNPNKSSVDFIDKNLELSKSDPQTFKSKLRELRKNEFSYESLKFISNDQFVVLITDGNHESYKISNLFTGEDQALMFKTYPIAESINPDFPPALRNPVFSDDGKLLFFESGLNRFTIFDANTNKELKISKAQLESHPVNQLVVSPNRKLLVNLNYSSTEFWNLNDGQYWRTSEAKGFDKITFSSDESLVALSGDWNGNVELVNYDNKRIIALLKKAPGGIYLYPEDFSPDKKILAAMEFNNDLDNQGQSIKLFDTQNGNVIKMLASVKSRFSKVAFDPNWKLFAFSEETGDEAQTVKIIDILSGKILYTIKPLDQYPTVKYADLNVGYIIGDLKFSSDGQKLLIKTLNNLIRVIDLKSGKQINFANNFDNSWYSSADFSSDGKTITVFYRENDPLTVWNLVTNKITKVPAKAKDQQISFEIGERGSIKIVSPDGKNLGSIYTANANDWLVVTPDGFFDGTPSFWKGLNWRFNNNSFDYTPVETFFSDFFHPNLLQDILNGHSPQSLTNEEINKKDRRQPKIEITSVNGQSEEQLTSELPTTKRMTTIAIDVVDDISEKKQPKQEKTSGAQDLRLFRNGSLVKHWHGDVFSIDKSHGCERIDGQSERRMRCRVEVAVASGQNSFTAYAFNHDNIKSEDATTTVVGADSLKKQGTLYVLAVGVNNYANSAFNLKFAVPDIEAIEKEISTEQLTIADRQFSDVSVVSLADEKATKPNIVAALKKFSGDASNLVNTNLPELDKIKKAQPEDAIIIYFAGHGLAYKDRFYLIPQDGIPSDFTKNITDSTEQQRLLTQGKSLSDQKGLNQLFKQSISDLELEDLLENVNAGKLTMVIDACNSGQALETEEKRRGPMNSRGLAQLAYEKGMNILTASQSFQAALEANSLNHGLLTYALLEGLKDADKNNDRLISDREWLDYAVLIVPSLQTDKQKRLLVQKKDDLPNKDGDLQIPRIFYRREEDAKPLIVSVLKQ